MILSMLREAWAAMGANRLRTFLTMLGLVIGVGAVVLMMAIGQGAQTLVKEAVATMGSNLFIVLPGSTTAGGVRSGGGSASTLTLADTQAIGELTSVSAVAPTQFGNAQLVYGAANWSTQVIGVTPSYLEVREWRLVAGQPFSDADLRAVARVALLGKTVVQQVSRCSATRTRWTRPYASATARIWCSECWRRRGKASTVATRTTPCSSRSARHSASSMARRSRGRCAS
jgi:putative ABC transport system permease protein